MRYDPYRRVATRKLSGGLCLLVSLFLVPPNVEQALAAPRLVSLLFNSVTDSPHHLGADMLRSEVLARAPGRLAIDERGGASVGSEGVLLAAVRSGSVNIAVLSASVVGSAVPALNVFDIPFLFRDTPHAKAVTEGPIAADIATKFPEKGLVLLAIGKQGFRNITNSRGPIRTPADLAGLKIRVIPNEVYQMTFRALGAEVIPMEFPLVYAALKDGRIQAQENPVGQIAGSRFYEVQKHVTLTEHFFSPLTFVANKDFFDSLDKADQAVLIAAARAAAASTWKAGERADAKGLDTLLKNGMEVVQTIDRKQFVDALKSLEPEFEKRFGKAILAEIRATQ